MFLPTFDVCPRFENGTLRFTVSFRQACMNPAGHRC
jgi:hypothetical protein